MVSATPARRNAARHPAPICGTFAARRWSSQISAGSTGRPSAAIGMMVPRCVVTVTPRTRAASSGRSSHSWRQARALAAQKPSTSCAIQPGCSTT